MHKSILDWLFAHWAAFEHHLFRAPWHIVAWALLALLIIWGLLRAYVSYIARHAGNLRDEEVDRYIKRVHHLEQSIQQLMGSYNGLPDASELRAGMVLVWNGVRWVGHPTTVASIRRVSQGRGKKQAVALDSPDPNSQPQTQWDRIKNGSDFDDDESEQD